MYARDPSSSSWYQRPSAAGDADDTAASSPLVRHSLDRGASEVEARTPVALHLNGPSKSTYASQFFNPFVERSFASGSTAVLEEFLATAVNLVGYRYGTARDLCYLYPSGFVEVPELT